MSLSARRVAFAFCALIAGTTIASAAEPLLAPSLSWTGFYVGGHAGGAFTSADGRWDPQPNPAAFTVIGTSDNFNANSFVGGFQAGYNWQFARSWVIGIEGDWSWTSASHRNCNYWTIAS